MPLPEYYFVGCVLSLLTVRAGLEDSRQHGCDFASVYANLLHFLPCADETDAYLFRVTNNVITSQTLSGFARGVFPEGNGDLPYDTPYAAWIQSADYDSLEPSFCAWRRVFLANSSLPSCQCTEQSI